MLEQARRDNGQIESLVDQMVELSSTTMGVPQATIDKLLTRLEQGRQTIGTDLARLRSADDHLRSESVNRSSSIGGC
ncbi:MAG TPA: hypothetical protein VFD49_07840 [Candidatus Dormibacteraeota bacterium]|nr:hypothetical protein [Candidatus Dormibacteraeota bacterium]